MDFDQIFDKLPPRLSLNKTSWRSLEPEEVFLDARRDQRQKIEEPIKKRSLIIFYSVIVFFLLVLGAEAGWLQLLKGAIYAKQAEKNRIRAIPIFAPRGIIYDRNGKQLVYNVPVFNLVATPAYLPKDTNNRQLIISKVAGIFGNDAGKMNEVLAKHDSFSFEPVILAEDIDREKVLLWDEAGQEFSGINLEKNLRREYVDGLNFSHILGYVGRMDKKESEANPNYFLTETLGKSGLELQYQNILRTSPGRQEVEVNARGEIKKIGIISESTDVESLVLSLDAGLQKKLADEISGALKRTGGTKAAALALDPRDGKILALLSFPTFDNNALAKGISQEEYDQLFNKDDQPLFNRAVSGQYPPGSTIKPFFGVAALQEGVVKPNTTINDSGAIIIPNPYSSDIVYTFPDWKTHGPVNIFSAIAESCDIYFYTIGGGFGDFKGLGIDRLEKYLKLFGFGGTTGIDLPNEKTGFVPSAQWKKDAKKEDWYIGDTYHLSIGQGDLTVTPLQMAGLTAAIANNGTVWQPQIVDKIIDSAKNIIKDIEPVGQKISFISEENFGIIHEAMRQTILSGSAQYLKDLPIEAAGKTGTAQTSIGKPNNSWFTVFAPYKNPEIVLVILVEGGGEGSSTAVPIAKEVLEWYFNK
jgi:penicillin-binding protein 2